MAVDIRREARREGSAALAHGPRRRGPDRGRRRRRLGGRRATGSKLVLVVPALLLFAGMVLVPLVLGALTSFSDWDGLSDSSDWVGIRNYTDAFQDESSRQAITNTVVLAFVGTLSVNVVGLALAFAINGVTRGRAAYRAILFFPIVMSPLITGFLWRAILSEDGVVNGTLAAIGLGSLPFLTEPGWSLMAVTGVFAWQVLGLVVLVYSAAIQNLPRELEEAALIDGASSWQLRRLIQVPLLAPAIALNTVVVLTWTLREYDRVVALTGGGPAGSSETFLFRIVYEGFERYHFGYSQAQTVLLVAVSAALGLTVLMLSRGRDGR